MSELLRVAVVGVGSFGRNHARIVASLPDEAKLTAVVDADLARAQAIASEFGSTAYASVEAISDQIDAAIVAAPTSLHVSITETLLRAGVDVLVEKPIAENSAKGLELTSLASSLGRVLQVGHLERFNPAVRALAAARTVPLFFEIHRLSLFSPRSLDIDVVLDLMIHDLDIVLSLTGQEPSEIHAAGISVLSNKVDIANVRLVFPSGCIANLTASRVSTEQVRKLRLFQPGEYISLDYSRQDATRLSVSPSGGPIGFSPLPVQKSEPLLAEVQAFLACVRTRTPPLVGGAEGTAALRLAETILAKIEAHGQLVRETIRSARASAAL
jgi:predicted dehydrogenase